uniref:Uncharacterized protein n=1 Tax=Ceratitis capitata TaxID=7213 RepID=W8AII5_CERCA
MQHNRQESISPEYHRYASIGKLPKAVAASQTTYTVTADIHHSGNSNSNSNSNNMHKNPLTSYGYQPFDETQSIFPLQTVFPNYHQPTATQMYTPQQTLVTPGNIYQQQTFPPHQYINQQQQQQHQLHQQPQSPLATAAASYIYPTHHHHHHQQQQQQSMAAAQQHLMKYAAAAAAAAAAA